MAPGIQGTSADSQTGQSWRCMRKEQNGPLEDGIGTVPLRYSRPGDNDKNTPRMPK